MLVRLDGLQNENKVEIFSALFYFLMNSLAGWKARDWLHKFPFLYPDKGRTLTMLHLLQWLVQFTKKSEKRWNNLKAMSLSVVRKIDHITYPFE